MRRRASAGTRSYLFSHGRAMSCFKNGAKSRPELLTSSPSLLSREAAVKGPVRKRRTSFLLRRRGRQLIRKSSFKTTCPGNNSSRAASGRNRATARADGSYCAFARYATHGCVNRPGGPARRHFTGIRSPARLQFPVRPRIRHPA